MTTRHATTRFLRTLVGAAAVALLAACGSSGAQTDAATSTAQTTTDATAGASETPEGGIAPVCAQKEDLTYAGQDGETALDLLRAADPTAEVSGEGENAFVTAICGYTAQESDNEFWALYVDGEQAEVGAGSLETSDGQELTWTLETY